MPSVLQPFWSGTGEVVVTETVVFVPLDVYPGGDDVVAFDDYLVSVIFDIFQIQSELLCHLVFTEPDLDLDIAARFVNDIQLRTRHLCDDVLEFHRSRLHYRIGVLRDDDFRRSLAVLYDLRR